jgi:hypothetical protein
VYSIASPIFKYHSLPNGTASEKSQLPVKYNCCKRESQIRVLKRGKFLIRTHNETLPVVAMRIYNPDLILTLLP